MGEQLNKYKELISGFLSRFSKSQKIIFVILCLLIFGGSGFFIYWITKPEYAVLFSQLEAEDANLIVQKLKEAKIDYKLADGGATVLVPVADVYEQRLTLAGQGLPKKGSIGFDIFDKTNLGTTGFVENTNYQRALQGELEKTINQLEGVDDCRVHIAIAKSRLVSELEQEGTASVVLYLKPGVSLEDNQVNGIVHLVSSSIVGLKPENVSVLDNYGNVISSNLFGDKDSPLSGDSLSKYYKLKKGIEKDLQFKIQRILDSVIGPDKSVVQVSVEVNLDKKEINKETFLPTKGTNGVLRSEQVLQEKYQGAGQPPSSSSSTDQNIPSYPAASKNDGKNKYNRNETISNYEISTETTKQIAMPGEIKFISVGVGIDKNLNLPPEDLANIKDLVASSLGLDSKRGDQLKVAAIVFNAPPSQQTGGENIGFSKYYYIIGGLLLLLIIMVLLLAKGKKQPDTKVIKQADGTEMVITDDDGEESFEQQIQKALDIKPESPVDLGLDNIEMLSLEDKKVAAITEKMVDDVKTVAMQKPEDVALLFRLWLAEDE